MFLKCSTSTILPPNFQNVWKRSALLRNRRVKRRKSVILLGCKVSQLNIQTIEDVEQLARQSIVRIRTISGTDERRKNDDSQNRSTNIQVHAHVEGLFGECESNFYMTMCGTSFHEFVKTNTSENHVLQHSSGYDSRQEACWEQDLSGCAHTLTKDDSELVLLSSWIRSGAWIDNQRIIAQLVDEEDNRILNKDMGKNDTKDEVKYIGISFKLRGGVITAETTMKIVNCGDAGESDSEWLMFPHQILMMMPQGLEKWTFSDDWRSCNGYTIPNSWVHYPAVMGTPPEMYFYRSHSTDNSRFHPFTFSKPLSQTQIIHHDALAPRVPSTRGSGGHILVRAKIKGFDSDQDEKTKLQDAGWWILDSGGGNGTFAITKTAADKLGMTSFGECYMNGIGNCPIKSRFRKLSSSERSINQPSLLVGQVEISNPIFVELELDGAIRYSAGSKTKNDNGMRDDKCDEVIGIIGSALLSHSILEIRVHRRSSPGSAAPPPPPGVSFYSPTYWKEKKPYTKRVAASSQKIIMINNKPHMYSVLHGNRQNDEVGDTFANSTLALTETHGKEDEKAEVGIERLLLQIGLGIGGTSLILRKEVLLMLSLGGLDSLASRPDTVISSAGESQARMLTAKSDITSIRLPAMEVVGTTFRHVRALIHTSSNNNQKEKGNLMDDVPVDLELSRHAAGIISSDILRGCLFVLDCSNDQEQTVSITSLE